MVNNIGGSSGAQSSYYSQANDTSTNRSGTASKRSVRSSGGQFGPLSTRQNTISEFGSVASEGPVSYAEDQDNPYFNQNAYSQWHSAVTSNPSSVSSDASYGSIDNRSLGERTDALSQTSSHLSLPSVSDSSSKRLSRARSDASIALSDAGSRHSSVGRPSSHSGHLSLPSLSGSPSKSLGRTSSDVSIALSDAGSGHSSVGRPSSHSSSVSGNSHQNYLPSVSDGGYQQSLTGSEMQALRAARTDGRFNADRGGAFSRNSASGSVASSLDDSERAAVTRALSGGRLGFRGGVPELRRSDSSLHSISSDSPLHSISSDSPLHSISGGSSVHSISSDSPLHSISGGSSVHSIAESLSEAGSSSSAEREALIARLNALRNIEGSISADRPSVTYRLDTEISASEFEPSTAPTEVGPPSRRPPRPPSRLRTVTFADSDVSTTASSYRPSAAPPRGGPAIYGRQPALSRLWKSLNPRK